MTTLSEYTRPLAGLRRPITWTTDGDARAIASAMSFEIVVSIDCVAMLSSGSDDLRAQARRHHPSGQLPRVMEFWLHSRSPAPFDG
jgi:hypothetical protein